MSVNKVMLLGRLGKDPELKTFDNGSTVCNFSVATDERYKDKNGDWQTSTEWHQVTVWGKVGENCNQYLSKGSQVFIEGKNQTDTYEKDGETRYSTKVVARSVTFLDTKNKTEGAQNGQFDPNGDHDSNLLDSANLF